MFELSLGLFVGYLYGLVLPVRKSELTIEDIEPLYPVGQPFVVYGGPGGHTGKNALWLKHFANIIRRHS